MRCKSIYIPPYGPIGPKCLGKLIYQIFMMYLYSIGQDCFKDLISLFHLPIVFFMVQRRLLVHDLVLCSDGLHQFWCKLCSLIYHNFSSHTKMDNNILEWKWNNSLFISMEKGFSLYPFSYVILCKLIEPLASIN